MNLTPVLAFSNNDYPQAERLLDLIAMQRNKKPKGYLLLVAAPDTNPEQHKKLQIAAGIGFEHVGLLTVGWPKADPKNPKPGKYEYVNHLFAASAMHFMGHYRNPFIWLEPDAVPTHSGWLEQLESAYESQPKRYMGAVLANADGKKMLGRVGIYPADCSKDLHPHFAGKNSFEFAAGESLVNRASKSKAFQQLSIMTVEDTSKVRADAAIVHGDKQGILLEQKISELAGDKTETVKLPVSFADNPSPVDGRTKAGRAARAAQAA